ncbi:hypothetical protein ZTR_00013 [Talaromyces verruculosus]|nr:hypothetical protein ZTR_00013 [Talaromyces verruculosus]
MEEVDLISDLSASDLIDDTEDLFLAACIQEGLEFDETDEDEFTIEKSQREESPSTRDVTHGRIRSQGQPFAHTIRNILVDLVAWGGTCELGRDTGAFRTLLGEIESNIDQVLDDYLKAIPQHVQALFQNDHWSFDDLVSLSDAKEVQSRGVYIHLLQREYRGMLRTMAYVGFSQYIERRLEVHDGIIDRAKRGLKLPKILRSSQHYRHAIHTDDTSCYKILAIFDDTLDTRYLVLLESLFMILFGTIKYPGFTNKFNPKQMYHALDDFSETLGIVSPLFGLNLALSVCQSMPHPWSHLDLPCCACQAMTYPSHHLPGKTSRGLFDSNDPSKGYLCKDCRTFRGRYKRLPTQDEIRQRPIYAAHRKDADSHASCEICNADFRAIALRRNDRIRRHYIEDKWCCMDCRNFYRSHHHLPTPEDIKNRKEPAPIKKRASKAPAHIIKCQECDLELKPRQKQFKGGKWCCTPCARFYKNNTRWRTAAELKQLKRYRHLSSIKACQSCLIPWTQLKTFRHLVNDKRCCNDCKLFYKENGRFMNENEIKLRQELYKKKE